MLTAPHAAAGVAIGVIIPNPLVAAPVAVASHFLLDMVPHWQETLAPYTPTKKTYIRIPLDMALAIGITLLAVHWQPQNTASVWAGAIFANVPDLDSMLVIVPSLKKGIIQTYWDWHCKIQRETSSLWGLLPQLALIAASLVLVHQI